MFRLRKTKRTVKNSAKEIPSTAKFIPSSDVEMTLEDIPEELRLEQSPDIVDKIIKQEFRWSPVKGAREYEIALKNLQRGKWQYFGHIKDMSFSLPESLKAGKYLWKVRAGGDKYSKWSLQGEFLIDDKGNSINIKDIEFRKNIELKKREIDKKEVKLKSTPIQLAIILEGRGCNIACIYCSHILKTKSKERLHPKLVEDLIQYLPLVRTISFGGSEPMIYPEYRQICDMVEDYPEVQLSVCTNGMLIDEYWAERFCKGNFHKILISVDGATPKTYEAVRRRGVLEKILHGLDLINHYRQKGIPRIQWNFVVNNLNFHEIVQLVELAHNYYINVVNFKMLIVEDINIVAGSIIDNLTKNLMKINSLENEHICLKILKLLEEAELRAAKCGICIIDHVRPYIFNRYPHLANSKHNLQELIKHQTLSRTTGTSGFFCHMPFVNLSFGDGRSHFCCYAKEEFLLIPYNDECKRIDDIWNSPKYQEARQLMYEDHNEARNRICKLTCPYYSTGLKSPFLK